MCFSDGNDSDNDVAGENDGTLEPDSMTEVLSRRWHSFAMLQSHIPIGIFAQQKRIIISKLMFKKEHLRTLAVSILVCKSYTSFDPLPAEGNAIET